MGNAPFLLSHCGFFFVFGSRVSFLVDSSPFFVDDFPAVSCGFGIFKREGELRSFYSTILFCASCCIVLSYSRNFSKGVRDPFI